MPETKTVVVPIGLNDQPQPAQQERPEWARKSLHNVRMPRQEVELQPEWVNNGPNVELKWQPVEPEPAAPAATQPYQQHVEQGVNYMEQNQSGNNNQQPQAPQPPDLMNYDPYNPDDVARFHQDNSAYMQSVVDQRVQAALQPHMENLTEAKWRADYYSTFSRYGDDPNFKEVIEVALQRVADERGKISILQAYQEADNKDRARPGQKGSAHLPEAFRDKRRGIANLGKIIEHNHQTGRAKPFGNRSWKG